MNCTIRQIDHRPQLVQEGVATQQGNTLGQNTGTDDQGDIVQIAGDVGPCSGLGGISFAKLEEVIRINLLGLQAIVSQKLLVVSIPKGSTTSPLACRIQNHKTSELPVRGIVLDLIDLVGDAIDHVDGES